MMAQTLLVQHGLQEAEHVAGREEGCFSFLQQTTDQYWTNTMAKRVAMGTI
jgi:hypothetical protein